MEIMIVFLLLIAATALLLGRSRPMPGNSKAISAMPGILPESQNTLEIVKIDRSLLLAAELGAEVVCEGIETEEEV